MGKKRIKDLPLSERPREKLLAKGSTALSEGELLAILLGNGTAKQNALQLANAILKKFTLSTLSGHASDLKKIPGVGKTKLSRILAAVELGERLFAKKSLKNTIQSTEDILREVEDIAGKKQEHLRVLYLNARHELIQKEIIAIGNVNVLGIEMKEVFSPALLTPCVSIVVIHNHPSGDPTPSDADIQFTHKLHEAGKLLGIVLFDHVIVSTSSYFSFAKGK